jgi:hypothetical protein
MVVLVEGLRSFVATRSLFVCFAAGRIRYAVVLQTLKRKALRRELAAFDRRLHEVLPSLVRRSFAEPTAGLIDKHTTISGPDRNGARAVRRPCEGFSTDR